MIATRFTNGFSEKILFQGKHHFWPKERPHKFVSALSTFFEPLPNERGQDLQVNILIILLKRISFRANGPVPKVACHKNSGSTPRIFINFCIMKGT